MALQGLESLRSLMDHHLAEMAPHHKRALLLSASGKSPVEIGEIEGISEGSAKQRLGVATAEIAMCVPEGNLAHGMRSFWVAAHIWCCLKAEAAKLGLLAS